MSSLVRSGFQIVRILSRNRLVFVYRLLASLVDRDRRCTAAAGIDFAVPVRQRFIFSRFESVFVSSASAAAAAFFAAGFVFVSIAVRDQTNTVMRHRRRRHHHHFQPWLSQVPGFLGGRFSSSGRFRCRSFLQRRGLFFFSQAIVGRGRCFGRCCFGSPTMRSTDIVGIESAKGRLLRPT
jgi:hypothetical protein